MQLLKVRFSLKALLAATTVFATLMGVLMIPTFRAKRLVEFVRTGQNAAAEEMLPTSFNAHDNYRLVLGKAKMAIDVQMGTT